MTVELTIEEIKLIIQSIQASWYQGQAAKLASDLRDRLQKLLNEQ